MLNDSTWRKVAEAVEPDGQNSGLEHCRQCTVCNWVEMRDAMGLSMLVCSLKDKEQMCLLKRIGKCLKGCK